MPCHDDARNGLFGEKRVCADFDPWTPAEIVAEEKASRAAVKEAMRRIVLTEPLIAQIKRNHRRQNARGQSDCPACGVAAALTWSHAPNGHVAMKCRTDNCLAFME